VRGPAMMEVIARLLSTQAAAHATSVVPFVRFSTTCDIEDPSTKVHCLRLSFSMRLSTVQEPYLDVGISNFDAFCVSPLCHNVFCSSLLSHNVLHRYSSNS